MGRTWTAGFGQVFLSRKCCFIIVAMGAIGTFEQSALAQATNCYVQQGVTLVCPAYNFANGGAIGVIGRDSYGNQWVGWKDATTASPWASTDDCLGWDWIGDTNGFFYSHTRIVGTFFADWLATLGSQTEFCGVVLDPPVAAGDLLTLDGFQGGADTLISNADFQVDMSCLNHVDGLEDAGCYFSLGGPGRIDGSWQDDYVVKWGSGSWDFYTNDGNDTIANYSISPTNADCGGGNDSYSGTPLLGSVNGCEEF